VQALTYRGDEGEATGSHPIMHPDGYRLSEGLLRRLRTKTRSCYCEQEAYQDEAVAEGTNELHA